MDNVARIEPNEDPDRERQERFAPLVVAYFVRAIESLNAMPRGPQLAVRRVWSAEAHELPPVRAVVAQHPWD